MFPSICGRGAKRFRMEILRGRGHCPGLGSFLPLLVHQGSVVSRCRGEGYLGRLHPGCTGPAQRNTRSRGDGSVGSMLYTYLGTCERQSRMFPARLTALSARPASPAAHRSAFPWPPNAARTCSHLPSKGRPTFSIKASNRE